MKQIFLSQGMCALVDDEDYEWLSQWSWYIRKGHDTYYAIRKQKRGEYEDLSQRGIIYMHRVILEYYGKEIENIGTDHKNGNGLDNQKHNLRIANKQQNNFNQKSYNNSSSKFKGITWDKESKRWRANITVSGKYIYLGRFNDEIEAAQAYNNAALKYQGEFARLNNF